jgi:hypothetical protein
MKSAAFFIRFLRNPVLRFSSVFYVRIHLRLRTVQLIRFRVRSTRT